MKKDTKESNISVYVRCRSRNEREILENSGVVVSTQGHKGKEVTLHTGSMGSINKTYTFDRVFGAESDQEVVFESVAQNVLDEMLLGYNCTIFAYGQTGTGKTFTMSGQIPQDESGKPSESSGIIPRVLDSLFRRLKDVPDYSVKISFIELYNEELRDLLSEDSERKVRIYDEPGKKSIVVQGMEEIFVRSAPEALSVLASGSFKRQVAATKCNDLSSRSHTVFTITSHMKEIDANGEEHVKVGKLNLVDLAGSENINRSGAENKRAREAGIINQSLLTLGRVINALVEHSSHIPYRESKLTRLLQDSLGGKTKTCIIATISPAKVSLEETMSTLEYASRAKNIKNKPTINQSLSKKELIAEYIEEIERLRKDLNASRQKNGIYVTAENYQLLVDQSESRKIQAADHASKIVVLEEKIVKLRREFEETAHHLKERDEEVLKQRLETEIVRGSLEECNEKLEKTQFQLANETALKLEHLKTCKEFEILGEEMDQLLRDTIATKNEFYGIVQHQEEILHENEKSMESFKKKMASTIESALKPQFRNLENADQSLCSALETSFCGRLNDQKVHLSRIVDGVSQNGLKFSNLSEDMLLKLAKSASQLDQAVDGIHRAGENGVAHQLSALREGITSLCSESQGSVGDLEKGLSMVFGDIRLAVSSMISIFVNGLEKQQQKVAHLEDQVTQWKKRSESLPDSMRECVSSFQRDTDAEDATFLEQMKHLIDRQKAFKKSRVKMMAESVERELEEESQRREEFVEMHHTVSKDISSHHQSLIKDVSSGDEALESLIKNHNATAFEKTRALSENINRIDQNAITGTNTVTRSVESTTNSLKDISSELADASQNLQSQRDSHKLQSTELFRFHENTQTRIEEVKTTLNDSILAEYFLQRTKMRTAFERKAVGEVDGMERLVEGVQFRKADTVPPLIATKVPVRFPKSRPDLEVVPHADVYREGCSKRKWEGDGQENLQRKVQPKSFKQRDLTPLGERDANVSSL